MSYSSDSDDSVVVTKITYDNFNLVVSLEEIPQIHFDDKFKFIKKDVIHKSLSLKRLYIYGRKSKQTQEDADPCNCDNNNKCIRKYYGSNKNKCVSVSCSNAIEDAFCWKVICRFFGK